MKTKEEILKEFIDKEKAAHFNIVFKNDETIYAAMEAYASQFSQPASSKGMEWVKSSEALPKNLVQYRYLRITTNTLIILGCGNIQSYFDGPAWHDRVTNRRFDFDQVEWLDEHGEKQEEEKQKS